MGEGNIDVPFWYKLKVPWEERSKKYWELSELQSILKEEENNMRNIKKKIQKYSTNFFNQIINLLKLNTLKKELKFLENNLIELQKNVDKSIQNVEFYKKLNSTPRCLECGYDKLNDKPKHSCGGDIIIEMDKMDKGFRFNPDHIINFIYEYDEQGNVTKTQNNGLREWLDKLEYNIENDYIVNFKE